jgi:hypothetical protein
MTTESTTAAEATKPFRVAKLSGVFLWKIRDYFGIFEEARAFAEAGFKHEGGRWRVGKDGHDVWRSW